MTLELITSLFPLYLNVVLGYLLGKFFKINTQKLAWVMIYFLTPLVIFGGVVRTDIDSSILSLPLLTYTLAAGACLLTYQVAGAYWQDGSRNILALSAATANTGYFGIAIASLFFNEQEIGIYITAMLGLTLFEVTGGFYIAAKGRFTANEALRKVLLLPSAYAFIAAVFLNLNEVSLPRIMESSIQPLRTIYCTVGMMVVGIGLSQLKSFKTDSRFLWMALITKFVAWPATMLFLVSVDHYILGIYSHDSHQALLLISLMPVAANCVLFASLFDCQSDKAAAAVTASTIIGLIYVPLMCQLLIL